MTARSYSSFSKTASNGFSNENSNNVFNPMKKWEENYMYKTSYLCQSEKNVK